MNISAFDLIFLFPFNFSNYLKTVDKWLFIPFHILFPQNKHELKRMFMSVEGNTQIIPYIDKNNCHKKTLFFDTGKENVLHPYYLTSKPIEVCMDAFLLFPLILNLILFCSLDISEQFSCANNLQFIARAHWLVMDGFSLDMELLISENLSASICTLKGTFFLDVHA